MPKKKYPTAQAENLLKPSLESSIDPNALITFMPLRKEFVVADVGCGPGYLAIPLAKYLYEGRLYAVDVQKEMLDHVKAQAKKVHLGNITPVLSKEDEIPLEDGILDGAFASGVIHEADKPPQLIKEVSRMLKAGGWFVVVDWRKDTPNPKVGPPTEARIDADAVRELCESAGFRQVTARTIHPDRYFLLFRKPRG